jgi:hypothetical protein
MPAAPQGAKQKSHVPIMSAACRDYLTIDLTAAGDFAVGPQHPFRKAPGLAKSMICVPPGEAVEGTASPGRRLNASTPSPREKEILAGERAARLLHPPSAFEVAEIDHGVAEALPSLGGHSFDGTNLVAGRGFPGRGHIGPAGGFAGGGTQDREAASRMETGSGSTPEPLAAATTSCMAACPGSGAAGFSSATPTRTPASATSIPKQSGATAWNP